MVLHINSFPAPPCRFGDAEDVPSLMGFGIVKLTAEIPVADMIVSVVKDAVYLIVIFIIARKTNWFNEVQADDVKAFNEKVEAKMAAKAAKN